MGAAVHAREARETREMRETRVRACQHELTRRNFRTVHALSLRYVIACIGERVDVIAAHACHHYFYYGAGH